MKTVGKLFLVSGLMLLFPVSGYSIDADKGQTSPASPAAETMPGGPQGITPRSGKVVETMNGGEYTYIHLEKDGKKNWIAVPRMQVKVGQNIELYPGVEMGEFRSKSLNKTFENIIFSPGPFGQGTIEQTVHKKFGATTAASGLGVVKVEKAPGPDAYTVAEIFEKRDALDKKTVVVRGKVVKVSEAIMGKNWIHLQDGSGEPAKKNHNLVVTSEDLPAMGEIVTASGVMQKDRDFGSGYKYNVIVEDSRLSK